MADLQSIPFEERTELYERLREWVHDRADKLRLALLKERHVKERDAHYVDTITVENGVVDVSFCGYDREDWVRFLIPIDKWHENIDAVVEWCIADLAEKLRQLDEIIRNRKELQQQIIEKRERDEYERLKGKYGTR